MKLSWKIGLIIGLMVIMSMATIGTSDAVTGISQAATVSPNPSDAIVNNGTGSQTQFTVAYSNTYQLN